MSSAFGGFVPGAAEIEYTERSIWMTAMFRFNRKRRQRLRDRPFSPGRLSLLERYVDYCGLPTPEEQLVLRVDIRVPLGGRLLDGRTLETT